ncbi:hypothetical protein BDD26_0640 [Xenorhabdus cabanillasii]|uniref:CdiI C-terminal domain-containing protein n=1 Tax=Xenorhabdus cabanillasii TaxID=351673 RepID=A0A3D9UMX3_9GAMM|nr:hypothetical protein [Xenorhabdus cabanillasii]REF26071.1 hypothetical protein BDD26_0640 [Xenorhabdus cabanillasii]
MFNMVTTDSVIEFLGEAALPSSIIIDDFKEEFHLPVTYWNIHDYRKSWYNSLKEGLQKREHAALAVSMYEPSNINFIFTWIIYFKDKEVFIQNQTLFIDDCPNFSPDRINDFIEPRYTKTDSGEKISEWSTDLNSILEFYKTLEKEI